MRRALAGLVPTAHYRRDAQANRNRRFGRYVAKYGNLSDQVVLFGNVPKIHIIRPPFFAEARMGPKGRVHWEARLGLRQRRVAR